MFVGDDPVNLVDPSGEQGTLTAACFIAAGGALIALILFTFFGPGDGLLGLFAVLILSEYDVAVTAFSACVGGITIALLTQIANYFGL